MNITVVGLGKIGLPLAVQFAIRGATVFGVDINQQTVDLVNQGLEPFPEEEKLQEYLSQVISKGKLIASTNTSECVAKSEVVLVVVPLFVNEKVEPDFRAMDAATIEIAKGLKKNTLILYETTLPVGTTRNRFTTTLERNTGLKVGEDFYVAFSPERVLTGRIFSDLKKYPKIVGGVTNACTKIAERFYNNFLDFDERLDLAKPNGVWALDSCESAEFVKLAETTYRDVNIGLANQFAIFAEKNGLNIYEVIQCANSQKFSHIHQPGVSVGGHCIPIYPYFYLLQDSGTSIVSEARRMNESMPKRLIDKITNFYDGLIGKRIVILGISFRSGVKETYNSGALVMKQLIENSGGTVFFYDRLYSKKEILELGVDHYDSNLPAIDAIIIHNNDPEYRNWILNNKLEKTPIFDGRNLFSSDEGFNVIYQIGCNNPEIPRS